MAVAFILSPQLSVRCVLNFQAAIGKENMRITRKTEVRYAGGDADVKCPAYCWAPA